MGIKFDKNGQTTISRKKLEYLLKHAQLGEIYPESDMTACEGCLLIDKASKDFFPFPADQLPEWEKDGSCQPGDVLYKLVFIKMY